MYSLQMHRFSETERKTYSLIAASDGIKAREIAASLGLGRQEINHLLYATPLMRELCYQDSSFRWHALVRQAPVHEGLREFSGWYGSVSEFLAFEENQWLDSLKNGCRRIGRNLNDTRGLLHSFLDCRKNMLLLFSDLDDMTDGTYRNWELVFEFRLNRSRMIRIYADVLLIAPKTVFSLEFKMKSVPQPEEVLQAAKYCPYLEVIFGSSCNVIPALVLTCARDYFEYVPIGHSDAVLPVASGDMLFNIINESLGFLA